MLSSKLSWIHYVVICMILWQEAGYANLPLNTMLVTIESGEVHVILIEMVFLQWYLKLK